MQANTITEQDAIWLVEHADELLADWSWPTDVVKFVSFFRKSHSPLQASMLCELVELRDRAKAKFARAAEMFFDRRGYEQSTDEHIARYKAERFRRAGSVVDLCAGIGGDALALAQVCPQLAILDRCAATLVFARRNIQLFGLQVDTHVEDVRNADLGSYAAWHLDPDRRPGNARRSVPDYCDPPLREFLNIAGRPSNGAVKLSPAANVDSLRAAGVELEWIGYRRECQQLVAWFGDLARNPSQRCATWIDRAGTSATVVECQDAHAPHAETLGRYLHEPKPSVIAAGLEASLAVESGFHSFSPGVSYFTSDQPTSSPLASSLKVLDDFAYHPSALASYLAARSARVMDVKKRGVAIDPRNVKRRFRKQAGHDDVVLVFYPRGTSVRVAVTQQPEPMELGSGLSKIVPQER